MAKKQKGASSPKKGMNRNKAMFDLESVEYSFALNANFHDEHGSGDVNLQNEPSNIYCSGFKDGYKVIGHKFDLNNDKTYFFLVNPDTGCSEIGYINSFYSLDGIDQVESQCDCKISVILENPLQDQIQQATCEYNTIITDCDLPCENKCLNFDINYPIHESNVHLKDEVVGRTLYFTDGKNPQRYIQLDRLEIYTQDVDDCSGEIIPECLDCDEMRVFKLFDKPCLEVDVIQNGGNLRKGSYEALVAYCTREGIEISDYYSLTNPVTIFDYNNRILDQTDLDAITNFAIKFKLSDLDKNYEYYKIVVIEKSGLDQATSIKEFGVFPIDNQTVTVNTLEDKKILGETEILQRRPFYKTARGFASGNGFLFQYGLKAHREVNLQPVVNLLGSMVKWATVIAEEDLYENGANVSKYRGHMRDEVVPCSIKFFFDGGYETPLFTFIPRPPLPSEVEELNAGYPEDSNNQSILEYNPDCTGNDRNKRWQFENTAQILGDCTVPANPAYGEDIVERTITKNCFVPVPDTITGPAQAPIVGGQDLVTYINNNLDEIIASSDPLWSAVAAILTTSYPGDCDPEFDTNCDLPATLVSEKVLALSVGSETVKQASIPFSEYTEPESPNQCELAIDPSTGLGPVEDTTFMSTYMRPWEVVYERDTFTDISCASASVLPMFTNPQTPASKQLGYDGALGAITGLQTGITVSAVSLPDGFTNRLHTNARWFKIDFNGLNSVAIHISPTLIGNALDDICGDSMRVSLFTDCSAISDVPAYGTIINDMSLSNDPQKFIEIQASDFGGTTGTAYMAIDSPIKTDVSFDVELTGASLDITLTGTSGTANITVDGTPYTATFTLPDLTATANQFVTDHAATILATHGVTVTANAGVLTFEGADPLVTITIANTSGDLNGTSAFGSCNITIDGTNYLTTYNTDFVTTTADFMTNHTTSTLLNGSNYDILNGSNNIQVIDGGGTLTFRSTEDEYNSLSITTLTGTLNGNVTENERYNVLEPYCGCSNMYFRQVETRTIIEYTDLTFIKEQVWETTCEFTIPKLNGCEPVPYEYGLFSYWESTEKYPCNTELFDSSTIKVRESDLETYMTLDQKQEFEDYYTDGVDIDGFYIWKLDGSGVPLVNFKDRPIRHYKFPCSTIVPHMSYKNETNGTDQTPGAFKESVIYPIGFSISNEAIKTFLDIAVSNGLISLEERLKIRKYEIFVGDRSVDRSVIAKGLLFDMYQYKDNCPDDDASNPGCQTAYYPNYPLNTLGTDNLNGNVPHRMSSIANNLYTFHSPDTHFYKPFLPSEMKIEGYQFGHSGTYFDIVNDHPTWVILGNSAYVLAYTLASLEVALDIASQVAEVFAIASTGNIGLAGGIAIAIGLATFLLSSLWRIGQLAYQWVDIFNNLGNLQQFAYYSATLGYYNVFHPNSISTETARGIATIKYLKPGRISVPDETAPTGENFRINNLDREDSVFINIGNYALNYPSDYRNWDNYSSNSPNATRGRVYSGTGRSGRIQGNAASPYISLKQYLPAQYGSIYSIDWVHTGFCGDIEDTTDCNPIFGGDTYISRFAVKRKFPYFTSNAHKLAPRTPFEYSSYFNVNPHVLTNRYFVDYLITDNDDQSLFAMYLFPSYKYPFSLTNGFNSIDEGTTLTPFYIKPPYKFLLFSYGFPYFLVESVINCNYRYAKRQEFQDFYPNNQDLIDLTQESNNSIRVPNTYYYNFVYSALQTNYPWRTLPSNYEEALYEKINDLDNTVIYSRQDGSERSLTDNWLLYKGLDTYDFPKTFGRLIDMDSIESEAILARFENGFTLFGAIDQLRDRVTPETSNIGQGGIFAGRSINFNKTDLGYAGTQHKAKVSCEFGHFWPDVKRGQVFQLQANGQGLKEITAGIDKWFKEHLPFKITQTVQGLEQEDLDNNFKGLGITMGWDARSKRVFLTKLDYRTKVDNIEYIDKDFYIRNGETLTKISLQDTEFFEDCSFTIAYSPLTEMWISYYSFKPNYYIAYDNYFQTGVNYSVDTTEEGLWSHLPFLSSYQVFYGKIYPFIIESSIASNAMNSILESVEYWLDVRKYYNKYDFGDIYGIGFNKAWIYNNHQNSGQLNLVHQKNNDLSQAIDYPKHNANSIDILQSEMHGKWAFNYFYNIIRNEKSGLPVWKHDCNQINKTLDNRLLDYRSNYKDRLRGDYFLIRLQQDVESRFKMIYRFQTDVRDYYEQ